MKQKGLFSPLTIYFTIVLFVWCQRACMAQGRLSTTNAPSIYIWERELRSQRANDSRLCKWLLFLYIIWKIKEKTKKSSLTNIIYNFFLLLIVGAFFLIFQFSTPHTQRTAINVKLVFVWCCNWCVMAEKNYTFSEREILKLASTPSKG